VILPRALAFGWLAALAFVLANDRVQRRRLARMTKAELYEKAKDADVPGRSTMTKDELAEALRRTLARDDPLPPHTSALVKRAIALIQQRYDEPLSRQEIADAVGVSKDYLGRIFHQELGLSPWEYLIRYRVLRAKELLLTRDYSVAEIAARVGFDTAGYFSQIFRREAGCSPRAFRTQGKR